MKTKIIFLTILATFAMTGSVKAQLQINSDGGVRIGKALASGWTLSSKGFELNYNDIILHTGESGFVKITSSANQIVNPLSSLGFTESGNPITLLKTYLTGKGLCIGTSNDYVSHIYATQITSLNDVNVSSDLRAKENIQTITGAKDVVMRLNPVTYDLKAWEGYFGDGSDLKNKAGFIAQDVLDVLPDAVGYDEEMDRYSLSYAHFIPYLTQVLQEQDEQIQEQADQIQEMEDRIAQLEELVESLLPTASPSLKSHNNEVKSPKATVSDKAMLYQNTPNPFSENTVIRYTLDKLADASLVVKDMKGRTVYKETLKKNDLSGQVEIQAGKLAPGLYTYSLVAAGRTLDSKKMVVTE